MALSKALGAFAVDIDTRELFSILIIDGNLPVPMLAAAVTAETAGLAGAVLFLQVEWSSWIETMQVHRQRTSSKRLTINLPIIWRLHESFRPNGASNCASETQETFCL